MPLPVGASMAFAAHIAAFPPARVTLPWHEPGTQRQGKLVTVVLMFSTPLGRSALSRSRFNANAWKPALRKAGIPGTRDNGVHVLRHAYAWMLQMSTTGRISGRVAECLGHDDPGCTLRVYTHLMQGGDEQVRRAVDSAFAVPSPAQQAAENG